MAGACSPTSSTTYPSVAARLYAGAVDPSPMVTLPHRPEGAALETLADLLLFGDHLSHDPPRLPARRAWRAIFT